MDSEEVWWETDKCTKIVASKGGERKRVLKSEMLEECFLCICIRRGESRWQLPWRLKTAHSQGLNCRAVSWGVGEYVFPIVFFTKGNIPLLKFLFNLLIEKIVNWSIVDLQCCGNYCCNDSVIHVYTFFFIFFPSMVYQRILNIFLCAVQYNLVVYPFYIWLLTPAHLNLPPHFSLNLLPFGNPQSVLYVCDSVSLIGSLVSV